MQKTQTTTDKEVEGGSWSDCCPYFSYNYHDVRRFFVLKPTDLLLVIKGNTERNKNCGFPIESDLELIYADMYY